MFRKPKRKVKNSLRKKEDDDEDEAPNTAGSSQKDETSELLQEARKRVKTGTGTSAAATSKSSAAASSILHSFDTKSSTAADRDLVTSTADHHPDKERRSSSSRSANKQKSAEDGMFRNTERNKFHAGPIRAAAHVRVTTRFDYEPSICKDYKETGFCGFGDTCIYLHDRSDTLTGWQLEQQYEEQQKKKKEEQEKEMNAFATGSKEEDGGAQSSILPNDGIPFACHLCRSYFKDPCVTNCMHYFCEKCIMDHVRNNSGACPICQKDTYSVFNQPTKLLAKKRKVLGSAAAKADDSWEQYAKALSKDEK